MKAKLSIAALMAGLSFSSLAAETVFYTHAQCNGDVALHQNGYDFYFSSHSKESCIGQNSASSNALNCKRNMVNFAVPFVDDANHADKLANIIRYQFKASFDAHPYDEFNIVWQMLPGVTPSGQYPVFSLYTQKTANGKYKLATRTRFYKPDSVSAGDEVTPGGEEHILVQDLEIGTGKEYDIILNVYPTHKAASTQLVDKGRVDNTGNTILEPSHGEVTYGYLRASVDGNVTYSSNALIHSDIKEIAHSGQQEKMAMSLGQYWKDTVSNDDLTKKYKNGFKNTAVATQDTSGYRWHPTAIATPRSCPSLGS